VSELLDLAKRAAELAKQKGASDAAAGTYRSREVELGFRDGKVEKVSEATTQGLSMALYVDGRFSSVKTSDLRPEAIERFLAESIAMARTLTRDPFRALPDPKLYQGRSKADLQIFDPAHASLTAETRRDLAKRMEAAARAVTGADAILSVTTSVSDTHTRSARVTTNGFEGESESTHFSASASVSVKDADGRRPEAGWSASTRFFADIPKVEGIGREAAERALGARGAKKTESAVATVVVENRVARRLVSALMGPLGGRALQQKQSYLEGEIGKPVAAKLLTLVDDPFVLAGSRRGSGTARASARRRSPSWTQGCSRPTTSTSTMAGSSRCLPRAAAGRTSSSRAGRRIYRRSSPT
jgi:PmbA protein